MSDYIVRIRRHWESLSQLDPDTSIIDPNDRRGEKNRYIAWLRDRAFEAALTRVDADGADRFEVVLDYGCGSGSASLPLLRDGRVVVGIDIAQGLLAQAARRCATYPCIFARSDGVSLPLRRSSVDAVVTYGVLIYLLDDADAEQLLREIRASMRPGALIVIIEQAKRRRGLSTDGIKVFRTPAEWKALLEAAGFVVDRTATMRSGRFPLVPLIRTGIVPRSLWPMIAMLEGWFVRAVGIPPWDYVDLVLEAHS